MACKFGVIVKNCRGVQECRSNLCCWWTSL